MNCKEFREVARELLHPETAQVESVRMGLAHTIICEDCAAYLAAERTLDEQLGELAASYGESQPPARLEQTLLIAFRDRLNERRSKRPALQFVAAYWRWLAATALATAAVLALIAVLHHRSTAGITAHAIAPQSSPASAQAAPSGGALSASNASSAALTASADTTWTNGFVALPDSAVGDSLEGGAILRIEMPASALASLGLPTTGAEGDQLIPADVVVGQDGTLRAIRLATD
ncbi:MAG: hypothetical protein ACLP1Y_08995 [Candidatus Acidiferrales bacterium]